MKPKLKLLNFARSVIEQNILVLRQIPRSHYTWPCFAVFQFFYRRKFFRISKTELARTCGIYTSLFAMCLEKQQEQNSIGNYLGEEDLTSNDLSSATNPFDPEKPRLSVTAKESEASINFQILTRFKLPCQTQPTLLRDF